MSRNAKHGGGRLRKSGRRLPVAPQIPGQSGLEMLGRERKLEARYIARPHCAAVDERREIAPHLFGLREERAGLEWLIGRAVVEQAGAAHEAPPPVDLFAQGSREEPFLAPTTLPELRHGPPGRGPAFDGIGSLIPASAAGLEDGVRPFLARLFDQVTMEASRLTIVDHSRIDSLRAEVVDHRRKSPLQPLLKRIAHCAPGGQEITGAGADPNWNPVAPKDGGDVGEDGPPGLFLDPVGRRNKLLEARTVRVEGGRIAFGGESQMCRVAVECGTAVPLLRRIEGGGRFKAPPPFGDGWPS